MLIPQLLLLLLVLVPCICIVWLQELLKLQLALLLLAMLGTLGAASWTDAGTAKAFLWLDALLLYRLPSCRLLTLLIMLLLLLCMCARASPTSQELGHSSTAAPTPALLNKLRCHQRQPHNRPGRRLDALEECQRCCSDDVSAHSVLAGCRGHGAAYAAVWGAAAATQQAG
jgi:hypothetical protein